MKIQTLWYLFALLTWKHLESVIVIDGESQKGLYISEYCPKMEFCAEGAHIMCMYYDPTRIMGPKCYNPRNVSITLELANKLLDVVNGVRSKVALGIEKGHKGKHLPRGYGIFRLQWDNELATFAQVLANQCVLRHDLCRATKRFPDPGQIAGLVRFTHPDWFPVSRGTTFMNPGLSDAKVTYATTQAVKTWYAQKNAVTAEMIQNYPDWSRTPTKQDGRLFLEMVTADATHMGCGISAYREYTYHDNNAALNYNSIQVMCNFSSRPKDGSMVFNITNQHADRSPCGCPDPYIEDDDCLCVEATPIIPDNNVKKCDSENSPDCQPALVVLPIFTIEDAPSHQLIQPPECVTSDCADWDNDRARGKRTNTHFPPIRRLHPHLAPKAPTRQEDNKTSLRDDPHFIDLLHSYKVDKPQYSYRSMSPHKDRPSGSIKNPNKIFLDDTSPSSKRGTFGRRLPKLLDVKERHFNKHSMLPEHLYNSFGTQKKKFFAKDPIAKFRVRQSIFNRAPKFRLPSETHKEYKETLNDKEDRLDKQFSDTYDHEPHGFGIKRHETYPSLQNTDVTPPEDEEHHKISLQDIMKHPDDDIDYQKDDYLEHNKTKITHRLEEHENKLMALLDHFEREVKNIELSKTEKELFDAKIRKIYGNIIGKPDNLLGPKIIEPSVDKKSEDSKRFEEKTLTHYRNVYPERPIRDFDGRYDRSYYRGRPAFRHRSRYRPSFNNNVRLTHDIVRGELDADRRKYYQDKLDNAMRKISGIRSHGAKSHEITRERMRPIITPGRGSDHYY